MRSGLVAACVAAALATGCAGMPTGGDVHLGRVVPAPGGLNDVDVRVFPPSWHAGLAPAAVVTGFLHALVNDDDDYAIARSYLSASAAATWRPEVGLTTYDDATLHTTVTATRVAIRASRLGHIDRRGGYTPAPGTLTSTFTMVRVGGQWRIDKLTDGVLLSAADAQRAFRMAAVYYLNRSGTALVPDQVLLQDSQRGIATALMTALLAGPSDWLGPAVRTALPSGTTLVGNVPVHDDGVADVNLSSSVRAASSRDLAALSAQIAWTLRQVSGVTAVRLFADGAPLVVPNLPARQPVSAWRALDPAAPPASADVVYVARGRLGATGIDAAGAARSDPGRVVAAARSDDGRVLAVVQQAQAGQRLLVGPFGSRLTPRFAAATMTPPTFDADGDVVTAVTGPGGRRVVVVDAAGHLHQVAADPGLLRQPITALRISRDGALVALIAGGQLLVGRVSGPSDKLVIAGLRAIAPGLHDVSGVSWTGAETVAVTAAGDGTSRQVVETDTDGYSVRVVDLRGLPAAPVDVTGAPGQALVVMTVPDRMWIDLDGWRPLSPGARAVYSG